MIRGLHRLNKVSVEEKYSKESRSSEVDLEGESWKIGLSRLGR